MIDSVVLLAAFSIIYIFIVEVFTVLFRLTGLTEDVARFQVISLLTACGFTTSQSEIITMSKRRRKLASVTIIFGYIFSLIIVSVVVNVFFQMTASEVNTFVGIGITLFSVALILFLIIKSRKAKIYFDALISRIYEKWTHKKCNNVVIMDIIGHRMIASIHLTYVPKPLENVALKDSGLQNKYGVHLLIITREGQSMDYIDGNTILRVGDSIVVFGNEKNIYDLFEKNTAGA